jgi:hypothetical protein
VTRSSAAAEASFCLFIGSTTQTGCLEKLTLKKGGVVTGSVAKEDPAKPGVPVAVNEDEVGGVAAVNDAFTKFVIGSVEVDPSAKTLNGYTVSGFEADEAYNIVLFPKEGTDLVFPSEGQGIKFTTAELQGGEAKKTVNLKFTATGSACTAELIKSRGSNKYKIRIACSKALKKRSSEDKEDDGEDDDDSNNAELDLQVETVNGSAATQAQKDTLIRSRKLKKNRRVIIAHMRGDAAVRKFQLRLKSVTATTDSQGREFEINQLFDFEVASDEPGLEGTLLAAEAQESVSNVTGGKVEMTTSEEDEQLDLNESSKIDLPGGCFDKDDGKPSTAPVKVGMRKHKSAEKLGQQFQAKFGYVPQYIRDRMHPAAYRPQGPNDINVLGSFYEIFLPLGIREQLKQRALITLSIPSDILASTGTKSGDINIWHRTGAATCPDGKPSRNGYCPETTDRKLDLVNKTVSVSVSHFSVFAVSDSPPALTIAGFKGGDIEAFSYPNPADCVAHVVTINPAGGAQAGPANRTVFGPMIRVAVPAGETNDLRLRLYNSAGELVRTLNAGAVAGGQFAYLDNLKCLNDSGERLSSGVYVGRVDWGGRDKFFKMVLIRGSGL